ncbi:MAG: acyl carrier protein [Rickettsia sp.]|nr:acyl carrier protein [Rickettsia sp.]
MNNFNKESFDESIKSKIEQGIAEHFNVDISTISLQSKFVEDIGADSLDILELIMKFEQEFGCTIPEEDARKITTVEDLIRYISNIEKSKVVG